MSPATLTEVQQAEIPQVQLFLRSGSGRNATCRMSAWRAAHSVVKGIGATKAKTAGSCTSKYYADFMGGRNKSTGCVDWIAGAKRPLVQSL